MWFWIFQKIGEIACGLGLGFALWFVLGFLAYLIAGAFGQDITHDQMGYEVMSLFAGGVGGAGLFGLGCGVIFVSKEYKEKARKRRLKRA